MSGKAFTNGSPPLLLHAFATFAVGGAQMRFATLANAFGDRYRHIVVAMDGNHACARLLSPALDLRCEPIEAPEEVRRSGNVRRFRDLLRRFAPDLLITYNWGAIESGRWPTSPAWSATSMSRTASVRKNATHRYADAY